MDRGRRRARCLPYSSPARQRPSPAAPQPLLRILFQRRHRAASLRPAEQASIAVTASRSPSAMLPTSLPHQHRHSEHRYSGTMCFGMLISLHQIHSHAWMAVFNNHCSGDRDIRCNTHSPKHNHVYRHHNQMSVTGSLYLSAVNASSYMTSVKVATRAISASLCHPSDQPAPPAQAFRAYVFVYYVFRYAQFITSNT
jgi:hypothetical protein